MIFKITPVVKDELLENIYNESMKDLKDFYEINWIENCPSINIVEDRKTINLMKGKQTEDWLVGWSNGNAVYILNKDNLETESNHKYEPEKYHALIKHELSHSFYNILSGGTHKPVWLCEGVAIHTSGQNKFKKQPIKFKEFLQFYENGGSGVYKESGFFVQFIVEKFGKEKLLDLIKRSKNTNSESEFNSLFAKEYGFGLNYNAINKVYKEDMK